MSAGRSFLEASLRNFRDTKQLAERAMERLDDRQMHWQPDPDAWETLPIARSHRR